jgi:hypothetical protein
MPTIPTSRQGDTATLKNQLDTTGYTWADTRNAATSTGPSPIAPQTTNPRGFKITGGRGNYWVIERSIFGFDFSGVSGTITSMTLKLYKGTTASVMSNIIVVKNSNTWSSLPASDDYDVDLSTAYSSNFTLNSSGGLGDLKSVTLNSTAMSDAVGNSDFNIAVVDKNNDYDNVAPTGIGLGQATFYLYDVNYYPRIEYTVQTGYGQTINGVIAANVNKVINLGKVNILRIIDTPAASTFTLAGITGEDDSVDVTSLINGTTSPASIQPFVDPSGTRLYIPEYNNKKIRQLSMSSANDLSSTISNVGVSSALTTSFTDFQMSSDGTKAYIMYNTSVIQYNLSTAWDITTMATIGQTLNVLVPSGGYTRAMHFTPDGTELIVMTIDTSPNQINLIKYPLSTAFTLSSAGSPTTSDITSTGPSSAAASNGLFVLEDAGTIHYVVASSGNDDTRYEDGILNADFAEQTSMIYAPNVSCEYTGNYMYSLKRTGATNNYTWTLYQHLTNI